MDFGEYQKLAMKTMKMGNNTDNEIIARITLGLAGEAGEVAEKVKKYLRGDTTFMETRNKVSKELGDVLWYLAALCSVKYGFNLDLESIATENIDKLSKREQEGKIKGSGDDR